MTPQKVKQHKLIVVGRTVLAAMIGVGAIAAATGAGVLIAKLMSDVPAAAIFAGWAVVMGVGIGVMSDGFGLMRDKKEKE